MAARESQGLQISLIIFVMVSVVLAVLTFVFYRSASEAAAAASAALADKKTADDAFRSEDFKVQYLQHILGAKPLADAQLAPVEADVIREGGDPEMAAIAQAYQQDMATFGEGLPEERRNYRELPGHLIMALRNKNVANTDLSAEVARLNNEKSNLERTQQDRTQTAQSELQKARDDLTSERNKFQTDWERLNQEKSQVLTSFQNTRDQLQKQVSAAQQEVTELKGDLTKMNNVIQQQTTRIAELIDEPFEVPDGRITWVNQASRRVWINLGMADGLRRQTTFSVYDQEAMNVGPSRGGDEEGSVVRQVDDAKGKIEVTRVLDQHLAEARIVDDKSSNPVLPGDQIFSPAWKPGRRVRFALVGKMDVDGDGRSDRELMRNIISMGGGVIDAEVHDDGNVEGELSPSTRYLVRGEPPTERRVLDAYSRIIGEAEQLGIQEISLAILLDLMGYKADTRVVPLGRPAGSRARPGAPRGTDAEGEQEDAFRERRPPEGGSAF